MILFLVWCYILVIGSVQGDIFTDLTNALNETNAKIAEMTKNNALMETAIETERMECTVQLILSLGLESIENVLFKQQLQTRVDLEKKLNENFIAQEQHQKNIHQLEIDIQKIEFATYYKEFEKGVGDNWRWMGFQDGCFSLEKNSVSTPFELLVQRRSQMVRPYMDLLVILNQLRLAANTLFEKETRAKELNMEMKSVKEYCQQRIKDFETEIVELSKDLDTVKKVVNTLREKLKKEENETQNLTQKAGELEKIIKEKLKAARKVEKLYKEAHFEKDKACYEKMLHYVFDKCWKYDPQGVGTKDLISDYDQEFMTV